MGKCKCIAIYVYINEQRGAGRPQYNLIQRHLISVKEKRRRILDAMCLNNTSEIKAIKPCENQLQEKTPSETVKEKPQRSREKEEMRTKKMRKVCYPTDTEMLTV